VAPPPNMIHLPLWKRITILVVTLFGLLFASPNVLPESGKMFMGDTLGLRTVNLGLDLQGGSHLLLEVEFQSAVVARLENLEDSLRTEIREAGESRDERIGYRDLAVAGNTVTISVRDDAQIDLMRQIIDRVVEENSAVDPLGLSFGRQADVLVQQEGPTFTLTFSDSALAEWRSQVIEQTIEIVRRRIDELGTLEPDIQRQGLDRVLVQVPGLDDPERLKDLLGETAKLTFQMVEEVHPASARPGRTPPGTEILPSESTDDNGRPTQYFTVQRRAPVGGDCLVGAQQAYNQGQAVVNFRFDTRCARVFGELTQENVGRLFAIVLDGEVLSAPVIREPILGGSGQISGSFTVQEASDLALLLRAGALPAPVEFAEERTVGPGLGQDSIEAGEIACLIGLAAVIVFMVMSYGLFGVFANIALFLNLVLLLGALSLLQATLTLPGIAGIVLTVGMAVDANVLIFERIREETRAGRSPISAVDAGYGRALTTIIDSNLTTLIAAVLLFHFGSGPVRGFAVTLALGIVTSMFSAIMVTRLMVVTWLRSGRRETVPI